MGKKNVQWVGGVMIEHAGWSDSASDVFGRSPVRITAGRENA